MRYRSTRGGAPEVTASEAMRRGLAPDGGLYVPTALPSFDPRAFDGLHTVAELGAALLRPFFAGDPLEPELGQVCAEAFDFPMPLRPVSHPTARLLELFWGPTAAFKDFGARFLARAMSRGSTAPLRIVVATSGDTGGAVAAAFSGVPNVDVIVLYPLGMVSARQEHQLCGFGGNVRAFAVRGTFDDCQALAKAAFADPRIALGRALSSANSINVGRLLPQLAYHGAAAILQWRASGRAAPWVVPSGNVGNATAALWARACGLPIGRVVLAANANRAVLDWVTTGAAAARPTVATVANAMDVGAPSNLERLVALFPDGVAGLTAHSVDDDAIRARIRWAASTWGVDVCPHTACGVEAWIRDGADPEAVLVATAHPAKFEQVVEPLVGHAVPVPPALAEILARPWRREIVEPTLDAIVAAL